MSNRFLVRNSLPPFSGFRTADQYVCIIVSTEHNIQLPLSADLDTNTHKRTVGEGIHLVFVSVQVWYVHKHLCQF